MSLFKNLFFSLKLTGTPEIVDFDPDLAFRISRSHGTKKIIDFDPNCVFPDCNYSLNSLRAMKWCTKLEAT